MDLTSEREAAIFSAARRLPVGERAFYLEGACAGDALLRRQIEELLEADESAGAFLAELTAGAGGPVRAGAGPDPGATLRVAPSRSAQPGDTIDRYKLMEKIGEGGCGVVYVAEQTEPVRRRVALKVIKLGMDTRQVVARFEAERQALAMMDHPNIAKVLDGGTTQTGRPYFVMELVRGIRITDYCDEANLSTRQRLELFIQVCQAIQHAHQKGIIHRDIKPSNILVTLHDGVPVPKVIDFGIAKATEGRLTEATVYTQLHQFIGTPAYMSPEQAEMSGLDIDTRSDIYSLGVLLYELLVGSTPFDAKELMASGLEAMRKTIREQEPVRPSTKLATLPGEKLTTTAKRRSVEASRLVHLLRGDLDWIVMKCLEKDRSRRYETANGLAADLKRHLNREPVVARPPSSLYRFQKMVQRNKLAFAAAGAVAAALVLGLGVSTSLFIRESKARDRAVAAERQQSQLREAAVTAKESEAQQRRRAEAGEQSAQRLLYASDMNLALRALETKNVGFALQLLDRHKPKPGQSDLRGWEWRYVWKQTRSDALQTLGSHSNTVYDTVFSPKGDVLATCSEDHTVRVWELTTRREPAILQHPAAVAAAGFSADGKRLVTACADGNLRLWDVTSRGELRRIAVGKIEADRSKNQVAFSRGAELFAFADETATLQVWDVATGTRIASLHGTGQLYFYYCLAFSPDSGLLAAGHSGGGTVDLWDLSRSERVCSLSNDTQKVSSVAFSSDGKTLACACWGDSAAIRLWDLAVRRAGRPLTGHSAWISAMAFSPDDKTLASASVDHTVRLWNLGTGEGTTLRGDLNEVWAMAMARDGRTLASGTKVDGTVKLWSTLPKPEEETTRRIGTWWSDLTYENPVLSPDGTALLKPSDGKTISVWDIATLAEMAYFPLDFRSGTHFAISPFGKLIAFGDLDGAVKLVEVSSRQEIARLAEGGAAIEHIAFSRDGNRLAAAAVDRKLRVWAIATRKLLCETEGHANDVNVMGSAFSFSADGTTLGVGHNDKTAEIFEVSSGRRLAFLQGHKAAVTGAILLADRETVATASYDQAVKLWDKGTQQELRSLTGESQALFALALSPDGRRLATGGSEGTLRLWDVATSQLVAVVKVSSKEWIMALAFSPDGNTLMAITTEMLRVWRAPSWAEIEAAEAKERAGP
jgi:WD40 repeat protein/serine/threonine protein kinase